MGFDFKNKMRTQCEEVKLSDGIWLNMYEQYSTHTINLMFDMFENLMLQVNGYIKGKKQEITLIPFYLRGNRNPKSQCMVVWIKEE